MFRRRKVVGECAITTGPPRTRSPFLPEKLAIGRNPRQLQHLCGRRRYFAWQLRLQVRAWLSHELRHGVLNVTGHARLQDAAWFEQFDMHASEEASANRNLPAPVNPLSANAVPSSANRTAVAKVNFMWAFLIYSGQQLLA
jgi:hypothetical protein